MEITSNSRPSKLYVSNPDELFVHDKITFREWCRQFSLDIEQLSILFDVSKPAVYKYIDMSSSLQVRKPIIINCNLISSLGRKKAEAYLSDKLSKTEHPWPSPSPIGY